MKKKVICSVLLLVSLLMGGSIAQAEIRPQFAAAESVNRSALDLYSKLSTRGGNLFFSPYSISSALAMVQLGAREETLAQMNRALHFDAMTPLNMQRLRDALHANAEGAAELYIANSIWPQKSYPFLPEYIQSLKKHFGVEVKPQDFARNPEGARLAINSWVEEQTRNRIRDILQEGSVGENTRMVLANAIYFKGAWAQPFPEESTRNDFFYPAPDRGQVVKMMHQEDKFDYNETADLQIVRLPYKNGKQSMLILLPKERDGLGALEGKLDFSSLREWTNKMERHNVFLALPRFEMEDSFELKTPLAALGVTDLFAAGRADLSGMDGSRKLYVDLVIHKAFISVNEKETEAAAATVIGIRAMSAPLQRVEMRVDHPFLFLIQDEKTGAILFMGRVISPK